MLTSAQVKARAAELGFVACGITDLTPTPHGDVLDDWLARGYAGTMRYLHRQARKRKAPSLIDERARRAVVVLDNYYTPDAEADRAPPRIAKYARGRDYHLATAERLDQLGEFLRAHGAGFVRSFADAGPVPERELAQRAGLGWIGKNTMLVRPGAGSFFFIGSVFTDLELAVDAPFASDHCGSCTRCLDACPTAAFVEPRVLDATRCISYLTIEYKGPIPDDLVPHLDGWVFGCDVCNDVCPWNQRFAATTEIPDFRPASEVYRLQQRELAAMSDEEFSERFRESALHRAGVGGLRRNLKAALGCAAVE
jgi:epoxyqueuosine reductase